MVSETTNEDCMQMMARHPDKWFELACVDPPYGLGQRVTNGGQRANSLTAFKKELASKRWDDATPSLAYFTELFRVSKNQIIWGGNYFPLPPTRCVIAWDKMTYIPTMSQIEVAWTSFDSPARMMTVNSNNSNRIHPTQKPVALYKWLITNYAKQGDKILDTHLGSGSSRIAAWDLGFDFYGCELDEDYFREGNERFERHRAQPKLFAPEIEIPKQTSFLD